MEQKKRSKFVVVVLIKKWVEINWKENGIRSERRVWIVRGGGGGLRSLVGGLNWEDITNSNNKDCNKKKLCTMIMKNYKGEGGAGF